MAMALLASGRRGSSGVVEPQPAKPEDATPHPTSDASCVRRDTFELLPLTSEAEVDDYIATRTNLRDIGIRPSDAERERLYRACDRLGLTRHRVKQALDILSLYVYRDGHRARLLTLAEDLAANVTELGAAEQAAAYNVLGIVRSDLNDHAKAVEYYLLSYERSAPDELIDRVYALGNLGLSYAHAGDTTAAREMLRQSIALTDQIDDPEERAYNNGYDFASLARLFAGSPRPDSADGYLARARRATQRFEPSEPRYGELLEEYTGVLVRHQINVGRYSAAALHIDTMAGLSPDHAGYLRALLARATGDPAAAFAQLSGRTYDDGGLEGERVNLLIALSEELGDYEAGFTQLRRRLAESESETRQTREALTAVSEAGVRTADAQRAAAAQRHADEMAVMRAHERLYVAALGILLSLGVATFFFLRYRRSSARIGDLSALVSTHERDLERANEQLRARVASIERYNHLLSHDLREPIRSVSGFTKLLGRELKTGGATSANLGFLQAGVTQLEQLFAGVEALRQIEDRQAVTRAVDVGKVLRKRIQTVQLRYPEIAVDCGGIPTALRMPTDAGLIGAIAEALIDNACKFSHGCGTVAVEASLGDATFSLSVTDRGIGIAPAYRTQIFGPFKRLGRREVFPGAGMGLALAQAAAQKLGAAITVRSGRDGRGSVFEVVIPIQRKDASIDVGPAPARHRDRHIATT